jgi:hypothetical protein
VGGGEGIISAAKEATEGMPYRLVWEGQLSCELLSAPAEEIINQTLKKKENLFPQI